MTGRFMDKRDRSKEVLMATTASHLLSAVSAAIIAA
jgi:hypothetical protein